MIVDVGGDMSESVGSEVSTPLRVMVTGGTGTLGEAVVLAFAKAGHRTYFQYCRNERNANRLTEALGAEGFKIDFSRDFTLPESDFDVLVNCAGINISREQAHSVDATSWDRMLRVNVTVPFLLSQAVLPGMLRRGWGRIINVGSIYSLRGAVNRAPYVASKHALSGLTKVMALEYATTGVTCNEICPSAIDSDMIMRIAENTARARGVTVDDILDEYRAMNPVGRMATAGEVASAVLYLASPEAGFINGTSIPVDGGQIV
ncbi:SDR family NAD(P)-dependent oxidoreductase [Actinoplanes palleronii]|uniref:3-hydroxybutyrate dehydrogenase n=1 Tax=Actinoplanes palleronii TaxID=113570 RepID=A0ABQ4BRR4_9ACTN|nr:SDR family oxidoreductase [Actinoplanes palleronii]GIE73362.1 3-hydroxybutyrate dehydrogenase [Actinoplanes palleronii]